MDDFTRYTCVFFLVDKSNVFATFKAFIKGIHNEFETTIKKVRSNDGSEFKNIRIDELCDEFGIRHQFSAKYTPQSNGLVERKNRTLIDMARSILSEYNVSHSFWAEAINTACSAWAYFTRNPKTEPNRPEPHRNIGFFGCSVRFRFLCWGTSASVVDFGSDVHRTEHPKSTELQSPGLQITG